MKPRRRLTSVDLLPTIAELQESELQQSLDEYMDSIRELSQPTYPLSGPLQGSRLPPLRMAKYPSMSLACKPWALNGPDNESLTLTDSKGPDSSNQEPLDWLFAQAQHGGATLAQTRPEDVCNHDMRRTSSHSLMNVLQ
ncbi:protein DEPP [Rhinichthys klamathensis goyatoka]|uniref:protein DEPP n=1 Tax=Rhinichthys klamathensis goyatoka TaxID=3034132 RepID=UPI0024B5208A|nr:protein DEPP [Rhinichthys klamathensis goyatoka]